MLLSHLKGIVQVSYGVVLMERTNTNTAVSIFLLHFMLPGKAKPGKCAGLSKEGGVHLSEAFVVDEVGSVSVDQSVEGEAVLPADGRKEKKHQFMQQLNLNINGFTLV